MKELQDVVEAFEKVEQFGQIAALATIVKVGGSTYRRPGARMLMSQDGQLMGSISGGCLESDVFEHAQGVMTSGEPIIVKYDTMSDEDIVWGLGLGCNGMVQVLIERLTPESKLSPIAFIAQCIHRQQPGVLVTVFCIEGQVRAKVGDCVMLYEDGTLTSSIQDAELAADVVKDAWEVLRDSRSTVKVYQFSHGSAEVLIEAIQPPVPLVIFGAGHDSMPLVRIAKELGWHVTVVDSRPAYATPDRFPLADAVVVGRPEALREKVCLSDRAVAVVMTHNYLHDLKLLETLLPLPLRYIGILGPKSRTERLLQELQQKGIVLTDEQLSRLYGPVGLDIGSDTPEEIALAILAEVQGVLANRSGGFLRNRQGPIHRDCVSKSKVKSQKCQSVS